MSIRVMQPEDLDFAAACTAAEGWSSETRQEFEGFLTHDPRGCLIAEIDGIQAGICIATSYGENGFIGELIVRPEKRGQGLGRSLLEHAIGYLREWGAQNIYLDADPEAVPLYEKVGFRILCRSLRFVGAIKGQSQPDIRSLTPQDFVRINEMDQEAFGADRGFFLKRRMELFPDLCKLAEHKGKISGFIMGRRGRGLVSAGPWIVQSALDQPAALLGALAAEVTDQPLRVGVLETHQAATHLLAAIDGLKPSEPCWRMVLGPSARLGNSPRCYAIGSPAKG